MAHYQDELERLCFSQEEKRQMTGNLLAARRGSERRKMRPPYRALVAAVAAISILIGAAGAASLAGVSPQFRALFGITDEAQAEQLGAEPLDLVFRDQNGSGASITVKEVVADQERLYLLMEFTAPEGVVLAEPEDAGETGYWLYGERGTMTDFYADEACTQPANPYSGWSSGVSYLPDGERADNVITLLCRVTTDRGFRENAQYCRISGINSLWAAGQEAPVLEGLDIEVVVPMRSSTPSYTFGGRSTVKLGGTTLAVVENLSVSSVSLSMDLIIRDGAAYDAALEAQGGAWPVYVLLRDGTRVETRFEKASGRQDTFKDETGEEFFRADHIRLELARPIDVAELADIVFVGDNSRDYDGEEHVGETVYFHFWPSSFFNSTYWDEVNAAWKQD